MAGRVFHAAGAGHRSVEPERLAAELRKSLGGQRLLALGLEADISRHPN